MARCFQLYRINEEGTDPIGLTVVDNEICAFLKMEPNETTYVYDWYIVIGHKLAFGDSFEDIMGKLAKYRDEKSDISWYHQILILIAQFMKENYRPKSFTGK